MSRGEVCPAAAEDMARVREIFREFADWLQVDVCFKDFEAELAGLPGAYAAPGGGLWLAWVGGDLAGCAALRPHGEQHSEMKRLWVRPAFRGHGLGRRLAETVVEAARAAGHPQLYLATLGFMGEARRLYAELGFREVPGQVPDSGDDLRFMALDLAQQRAASA